MNRISETVFRQAETRLFRPQNDQVPIADSEEIPSELWSELGYGESAGLEYLLSTYSQD